MYYSQFGEDKILSEIFSGIKRGVCVEVGANDGVNDSTSLFFEKIGWDCVLVEPNPGLCAMIREARNSQLFECAASDRNGSATLLVAEGAERAHGVSTIRTEEQAHNKIKSYGFTYRPVQVRMRTLDEILTESGLTSQINFISIDVEGHELEVLQGFSIPHWSPAVLIVEDNSNFEDSAVKTYLKRFGYILFRRTGVNDWYAHKTNSRLVNLINRGKYGWMALKSRAKTRLKTIPAVVNLRKSLISLTGHS